MLRPQACGLQANLVCLPARPMLLHVQAPPLFATGAELRLAHHFERRGALIEFGTQILRDKRAL